MLNAPEAYDYQMWLSPFPDAEAGPLELVVDWPEYGIEEQSAEIDAERIAAAADDVVELCTDGTS